MRDPATIRAQMRILIIRAGRDVFRPVEGGFVTVDEAKRALASHPSGRLIVAFERRWPGEILAGLAVAFREAGVTVESRAVDAGGRLVAKRGFVGLGIRSE